LTGHFGGPKFGYDLLVKQPKKPNAVELAAEKERIGNSLQFARKDPGHTGETK
jgi:hypothetical protein